jgi:hypothetical protein
MVEIFNRKSKDWLAGNQDKVLECGDISIHELLFQWANTIQIHLSMLFYQVQSENHHHLIEN